MATAEGGGGAANSTSSSYGGGGAGGKFRKRPFRRQSTPYDRPPIALRGTDTVANNTNTRSWLTKLVVDPASKLISYGADRFLASVFRKRLPPPLPIHPPGPNNDASDRARGATINSRDNVQEPTNVSSKSNGISELEQLLKQKTFSRSEIVHLTELLQSRAMAVSYGDDGLNNEETALDFGRHEQFDSVPLEENKNDGIAASAVITTPLNSKICGHDIASPAELAKAYMGSRPSKVSPSLLEMRHKVRSDGVLSNGPFTSKSPNVSMIKKTSTSVAALENSSISPRSRGRSAIFYMARTPYSRVQATSILKGSGINSTGSGGPSVSSPHTRLGHDKFEPQALTLKRRSSVLDDNDLGSVGPIRRIRQKSNILVPRFHHMTHGGGNGPHGKQKLQLIGEQGNEVSKAAVETANESGPGTSYVHVPSKSNEVAARILQNLEKLTRKEKSLESKLLSIQGKSSLMLTPVMLSGRALRSMEDVDSSKVLVDILNDHKLENKHNTSLPTAGDSSSPKPRRIEEKNGHEESVVPFDCCKPVMKEHSVDSLRPSRSSTKTTDVVENGASQLPQLKRAFRMSAHEDSLEQDDDTHYNGIVPTLFSEKKGPIETPPADGNLAPAEVLTQVKTTTELEVNPSLYLDSSSSSGLNGPRAVLVGEGSSVLVSPASGQATATTQPPVLPLLVAAFDKPKETNSPTPSFSFSSKVADGFRALSSEFGKMVESNLESSSSLVAVPTLAGSQVKTPESDTVGHLVSKAGDVHEKSDTVPYEKGPLSSGLEILLMATADKNQTSTNDTLQLPSSISISDLSPLGTSMSATVTSSGSLFGLAAESPDSAGPLSKFGAIIDSASAVSAPSAANMSGISDLRTEAEIDPSFGISSSSHSGATTLVATNSGSNTSELGSLTNHSAVNNHQSLVFSSASKSLVSIVGTVSQGTSALSVSSASSPSSTPYGSLSSNSQMFSPGNTFGFSPSASSSDTTTVVPGAVPTSSGPKFGESITVSEGAAISSSGGPTPGVFGFNVNFPSTNVAGQNSSAAFLKFSGSSSVSASATNTTSSFTHTSAVFSFGGSSSTSSAVNPSSANNAPSILGSSFQSSILSSNISSPSLLAGFYVDASSTSSTPASLTGSSFGASSTSSVPAPLLSTGFSFGSSSSSPTPALCSFPSTGFSFGAPSTSSAPAPSTPSPPANAVPVAFNSSTGASSNPFFSFSAASASVLSSPSLPLNQPVFGNTPVSFAPPPGNNNDQMNAEDSMAEDPVQSSAPSVFGQPSVSLASTGSTCGSTGPSQANPFMFGGQQNQVLQNPTPFHASGSLEFNAGGSFSLGSGGGDKSNRKVVKISRNKNRKK